MRVRTRRLLNRIVPAVVCLGFVLSLRAAVNPQKTNPTSTSYLAGRIGAELAATNGTILITRVFRHMPADRAGLVVGDKILRVDSKPTERMSLEDVIEMMVGYPNTEVSLTVQNRTG